MLTLYKNFATAYKDIRPVFEINMRNCLINNWSFIALGYIFNKFGFEWHVPLSKLPCCFTKFWKEICTVFFGAKVAN